MFGYRGFLVWGTGLFLLFFAMFSAVQAEAGILMQKRKNILYQHFLDEADEKSRLYYVYLPKSYDENAVKTYPVVLVLHGGGGNARQASEHTNMNALADTEGFIAVYPEGIGKSVLKKKFATWNGGTCCGQAQKENVDDVAYMGRVLDQLAERYKIDQSRVYATGISNGGIMTHRLACEMSDRIAAVAPIASPGLSPDCQPKRPVPIMLIHGTKDQCTKFEGGESCGGCWQKVIQEGTVFKPKDVSFPCQSFAAQTKAWKTLNACGADTSVLFQKGDTMCLRTVSCQSNAPVVSCTIYGGGHTWPGAKEKSCKPRQKLCNARKEILGKTSRDFQANKMMWTFFKQYHLLVERGSNP